MSTIQQFDSKMTVNLHVKFTLSGKKKNEKNLKKDLTKFEKGGIMEFSAQGRRGRDVKQM